MVLKITVYPRKRNNNVILKVSLICVYNIYIHRERERSKRMTAEKKKEGKIKVFSCKILTIFDKNSLVAHVVKNPPAMWETWV